MEKYYRSAGLEFLIDLPEERMYSDDRHLAAFRTDSVRDPHCFRFQMVSALTPPRGGQITVQPGFRIYREEDWDVRYIGSVQQSWEHAYIRAAHRGKEHCIQLKESQFKGQVGVHTVLNCIMIEHLAIGAGGFIFHCSYIEQDEKAILFTAPSGTGKSTQADLWNQCRGSEIINGDRAAVCVCGSEVLAEGIPFSGSSSYCLNRSLPIAAVVYLQQAPQTTIQRIQGAQAFCRIWEGCSVNTWDREDVCRASSLVEQVVGKVPVFQLACTPDESAVIALEKELRKVETR